MRRLPLVDRLLLALIRGQGSEFVVGDILERFEDDVAGRCSEAEARRRLRRQTVATVARWWSGRRGPPAGTWERGGGEMATMWRDTRIAARSLTRAPGFALAVVVTLALGVGATSTIWSVVDNVLIRPLPYQGSGRLVMVGNTFPRREWDDQEAGLQHLVGVSVANWLEYRDRLASVEDLEALEPSNVLLPDGGDGPEIAPAARVSEGFFALLGISPVLGRTFLPDESSPDGLQAFLISHGAWLRRFGGDPSVVGKPVFGTGGGVVVGVLPEGFRVPEAVLPHTPDFWMALQPQHARYADRGRRSLVLLGRLAPGATLDRARTEARSVAAAVAAVFPEGNVYESGETLGLGLNGLKQQTVGTTGRLLLLFLAAAGMLLLIAALNSATLLLARTLDRARELGVRSALGASGGTLVRLVLTESVLLALAGGVLGAGLAFGGVEAVHRWGPSSIPRLGEIGVDVRVLLTTLAVAMGCGMAVGLFPALRMGRTAPARALQGGRGGTQHAAGTRLRNALVGAQVAVAVVLLTGAGLLMNSFVHLRAVDPGFEPADLLTLRMDLKRPGAPDVTPWQDWDAVLATVASVPGVRAVAGTSNPPFQSPFWAPWVRLPGEGPEVRESTAGYTVTPGYFEMMGTRLLRGRDFGDQDGPDAAPVAIVNEAWARQRMGGRDPVGQTLRFNDGEERLVTVVGMVENVVQERAQEGAQPAVYIPYRQTDDWPFIQVVARLELPAATVVPEVRKALAAFSPVVPARDVRMMAERIAATRTDPRFQTLLLGAFAALALLLASAGLYGSLAHAVSRRRRELGIRVALGAARPGLVAHVVGQGLRIASAGLVVGLVAAGLLSRALQSMVFGITPRDPVTYATVAAVLVAVAAVASFVPARRATAVDPVEVLKAE